MRQRLLLALGCSVALHLCGLAWRPAHPPARGRAEPLRASLRPPAAPAATPAAVRTPADRAEPERRTASAATAARTKPARPAAPPEAPVPERPPEDEAAPGRVLAGQAREQVRGVQREMRRQEGFLDPARGRWAEPAAPPTPRDAIAAALEKRFGRRLPFVEESTELTLEGGRMWRIRTEEGAVCIKELPPNVELSAPGQGLGKTLLVPMLCESR